MHAALRHHGGTAAGYELAVPDDNLAVASHRADGPLMAAADIHQHVVDPPIDAASVRIVVAHAHDGAPHNPEDDEAGGDERAQERKTSDG